MVLVSSALVTPKNRYLHLSLVLFTQLDTGCGYLRRSDVTHADAACDDLQAKSHSHTAEQHQMVADGQQICRQCSPSLKAAEKQTLPSQLTLCYILGPPHAGEQLLRQSGVGYTVVRPGGLTNAKGGEHLVIAEQGDNGSAGRISRADVAAICVEAVLNPAAACMTLELKEDPKQAATQDNIQKLFAGLSAD